MISRTVFRQVSRVASISTAIRPAIIRASRTATVSVIRGQRWYSKPVDDKPETAEEIFNSSPSLQKIKSSPEVLQIMMEIAEMMQAKQYVTPGEQPGMMAMMKIMGDKELRALLVNLKNVMDEQGIQLDQSEYVLNFWALAVLVLFTLSSTIY